MTLSVSAATATLLDDEPDRLSSARCPLCHTAAILTRSALEAGGDWRCVRCGQHWDARRLATVTAYAAWAVDHDCAGRRATGGGPNASRCVDGSTTGPGGRP